MIVQFRQTGLGGNAATLVLKISTVRNMSQTQEGGI